MEAIKSDGFCKNIKKQNVVTTRIITKLDEIEEIYSIGAESCVIKTEVGEGFVEIKGKLNFKLLVKDKNESIASLNYNAEYTEKFEDESFSADMTACASSVVTEVKGNVMNGNEIEVMTEIDFGLLVRCVEEISVESVPLNAIVRKKECSLSEIDCSREEIFTVTHEMTMPVGAVKVLQAEGCAYIENVLISDVLRLEGRVELQIVYINSENLPAVLLVPVDFDEEFELNNISEGDKACVRLKCVSTKVHLDMDESEALSLNAEMNIKAAITVYKEKSEEFIADAYSLTRNTELVEKMISATLWRGSQTVKIGFSGDAECKSVVSRVLGSVNARCIVVSAESGDGSAQIDGVVKGRIVYLDAEDSLQACPFELPISVLCSMPFASKECKLVCDACVTDISVKRNGGSADITGSVAVSVCAYENKGEKIVTEIIEGEEKGKSECAIEVFLAEEGDTLWNIGKTLSMTPEELLALNPELQEPITKPMRIVVYRQL